ncbi:hypothetical protein [Alteribacter lacisalsi]|uniref:hypothetical protein n=1 Tax=Alteribacter lacisalsi TaxID=2045244 RepID=UPI0013752490|nr:hypothetical protein [Alteribacter lacisalsi]
MTVLQKRWLAAVSLLIPALSLFVYPFFPINEARYTTGFPLRFLTHHGAEPPESRMVLLDPDYLTSHASINPLLYLLGAGIIWITGFFIVNAWNFRRRGKGEGSSDQAT